VSNNKSDKKGNPAVATDKAKKKLPPVDDKGRNKTPTQTEDILNSILPPRYPCF
jgi:dynein light intermediate chain